MSSLKPLFSVLACAGACRRQKGGVVQLYSEGGGEEGTRLSHCENSIRVLGNAMLLQLDIASQWDPILSVTLSGGQDGSQ